MTDRAFCCESCVHWSKEPTKLLGRSWSKEQGYAVYVDMPGTWGRCKAIAHLAGDSHSEIPTPDLAYGYDEQDHSAKLLDPAIVQAFLSDGSEYFASITTRNDFGCTLHESRADNE